MTSPDLTALNSFILQMHHSASHVLTPPPEGESLLPFMADISYHGDILMSPDMCVNLLVIYPDGSTEGCQTFSSHGTYYVFVSLLRGVAA